MANKPDATLLAHWRHHMDSNIPPRPKSGETVTVHDVISFNPGADSTGMHFRLRISDGQIIDVRMNPVVAHALAIAIWDCGVSVGWLEKDGPIMGRHRPI